MTVSSTYATIALPSFMTSTIANDTTSRRLMHTRELAFRGYLRDDGLLDIEGRMRDVTATGTELPFYSLSPGQSIHDMRLLMTVDMDLLIHRMQTFTDTGATPFCAEINSAYASLEGLSIGAGFKKRLRERVGGVNGCTHITEAMSGMANTAIQLVMAVRRDQRSLADRVTDVSRKNYWIIDSCHAYRSGGDALRLVWKPR